MDYKDINIYELNGILNDNVNETNILISYFVSDLLITNLS